MNGDKVLRIVAALVLWIAPLPAAFFVGRSVYWHLVYRWHLDMGLLGIAAAVIAGAMIELVGILSAHVALACHRWNGHGNVKKKDRPWERAPFWLAAFCFLIYALVAITLAVVLEAWPHLAVYAPALVTAMAADAYIALGIYEQHRDRLARYNLAWNWKPKQEERTEAQPDLQPTQTAQAQMQLEHIACASVQEPVAEEQPAAQQEQPVPQAAQVQSFPSARAHVRWLHDQQPELTVTELAQVVGCDVSTASRAVGKNGRGTSS